jgi:hypothetical protein
MITRWSSLSRKGERLLSPDELWSRRMARPARPQRVEPIRRAKSSKALRCTTSSSRMSAEKAAYNSDALPLGSEREGILFIAMPQRRRKYCVFCVRGCSDANEEARWERLGKKEAELQMKVRPERASLVCVNRVSQEYNAHARKEQYGIEHRPLPWLSSTEHKRDHILLSWLLDGGRLQWFYAFWCPTTASRRKQKAVAKL